MAAPFPDHARLCVSAALAAELLDAAERLPLYNNQEFYSLALQTLVHEQIRAGSPAAFDRLVSQVRERIAAWPYCVLLSGLRFDEGNRLFVGLNRAFGELVAHPYEKPRAQLVHYIQPATDRPAVRGTQFESEKLHTDTADWNPPVDLISMLCVRADSDGGGRSQILDIDTLRKELQSRLEPQTVELLETEPVPWLMAPYQGGGIKWQPVISECRLCWRRYTIDLALESGHAELSPEMIGALEDLEAVIATTPGTLEFFMREGELLFVHNARTIHARTSIANEHSDRLMIRSWIKTT